MAMRFVVKREPVPRRILLRLAALAMFTAFAASWPLLSLRKWTATQTALFHHNRQPHSGLAEQTCDQPAVVNKDLIEKWGCKLLRDSCLDQGRILIHTGQKTPGHPNWTAEPLFTFRNPVSTIVLPGYPEPLGTPHYQPVSKYAIDIRAPTPLDPRDVWQPAGFNNCSVPLLFIPLYFSIYADFLLRRVTAFSDMSTEGVFDRNVIFVPDTNGMDPPAFYQPLLEPFSRHKVESLASLSSRERIHEGRSRCYSQLLLCNVNWGTYSFKLAARRVMEYYKEKYPETFQEALDNTTFRVAIANRSAQAQGGSRRIVNLEELLEQCKRWRPPQGSRFKAVECIALKDFTPGTIAEDIAQIQTVHALVSLHGSGVGNGLFLPAGSAVVEVLCWNFCGPWPDSYFRDAFEGDQSTPIGYFRLVADKDHCYPGEYERNQTGSPVAYGRDQHIRVEFKTLARALHKIAKGQIESRPNNFAARLFNMTQNVPCPTRG